MKNNLLKTALTLAMLSSAGKTYSQARSNIGFGYGISRPYSGDYKSARGFMLQGAIALTDKIAIVPVVGYERLLADRDKPLMPYQSFRVTNIDLLYLGASVKYFFYKDFFVKAGPIIYAAGGNEDLVNLDIGGSGAIGYNLNLDKHSTLEFTAGTFIINLPPVSGNGTTSVASFKIAYIFNFRKLK
jgi:hypothetical protein